MTKYCSILAQGTNCLFYRFTGVMIYSLPALCVSTSIDELDFVFRLIQINQRYLRLEKFRDAMFGAPMRGAL
jgi:hypothetical protein